MPMNIPVMVRRVESAAWAMPKSITTGWPSTSMTLPGLRSRCTTPAACTAASAEVSPAASAARAVPVSGPSAATTSSSVLPGT